VYSAILRAAMYTADDLVVAAHAAGTPVTPRLIREWSDLGLLECASRPVDGRDGERCAKWPQAQLRLLLTLLDRRRAGMRYIEDLANVPVFVWLWYGDRYVTMRQIRRDLQTWRDRYSVKPCDAASALVDASVHNVSAFAASLELTNRVARLLAGEQVDRGDLSRALSGEARPRGLVRRAENARARLDLLAARYSALARLPRSDDSDPAAHRISDSELERARRAYLVLMDGRFQIWPDEVSLPQQPGLVIPLPEGDSLRRVCLNLMTTVGVLAAPIR